MEQNNTNSSYQKTQLPALDMVEVTYFTDPLCCWSWAIEPQWRRLQYEYAGNISVRYVMGGLIPDWKSFNDEVNSINRPAQMGPMWMQASDISGMPMPAAIWMHDAPVSSYPACIAVKCAQLQSPALGARYLRLLRENVMLQSQNISKQEVLVNIALQLAGESSLLDVDRFKKDLVNGNGLDAFRSDMHAVQIQNIQRFPALLFRRIGYPAIMLSGYKPYATLLQAFEQVATGIEKTNIPSPDSYKKFWTFVTDKELEEACLLTTNKATL